MGADKAVASGDERPPAAGSPSGYGWQDRYVVAVLDARLEALLEADVLAGDVDVDEAAQGAVLGDPLPQVAIGGEDGVERLPDVGPIHFDFRLSAGGGAQLGRDLHGDAHQTETSWANSVSKLSRVGSISCMENVSRVASRVFSPSPVM